MRETTPGGAGGRRLLLCYAHPDDESFGSGPLIAKYVAEGAEVYLICATNGEAGTVAPEHMNGHKSVSEVRLAELACAAQTLGLREVIRLGYRDSGMMGSADNNHPEALWQAPVEQVAERVAAEIQRIRPQVVITFDPYGGYGHPDHIQIHRATVAAMQLLNDDPARPQRLYYAVFPRIIVRIAVLGMRLLGRDPRRAGRNGDLDLQAVLDAAQPIHARVDVGAYYETGMAAARCHASQGNPRDPGPGRRWLARRLSRYADFSRAEPPPARVERLERDLFEQVRIG